MILIITKPDNAIFTYLYSVVTFCRYSEWLLLSPAPLSRRSLSISSVLHQVSFQAAGILKSTNHKILFLFLLEAA